MKTVAEQKRNERTAKRAAGWVLKQVWVKPSKWLRIQKAIATIQGDAK